MEDLVYVELRGKKFPLCLTVAALDPISEKCGGLSKVVDFITNGSAAQNAVNTAWLLGLLIVEGEEHRIMEGRFAGEHPERIVVPTSDDICHLLAPGEVVQYMPAVLSAVTKSLSKSIQAGDNPKNGDQADRK